MLLPIDVHRVAWWWMRPLRQDGARHELHAFQGLWVAPPFGGDHEAACGQRRNLPQREDLDIAGRVPLEKCATCDRRMSQDFLSGTAVLSNQSVM